MKKIFVCAVALCAYSCAFGGLFADAGGDYLINPCEEITLAGISPDSWPGGGQPCHIDVSDLYGPGSYDEVYFEWYIDSTLIYYQTNGTANPLISCDYLVDTLGLNYGEHIVQIDAYWIRYSPDWGGGPPHTWPFQACQVVLDVYQFTQVDFAFDTAALNIIPEPATMLLLSIGGILLRKKK
jgi:hypothetical protein